MQHFDYIFNVGGNHILSAKVDAPLATIARNSQMPRSSYMLF